MQVEIREIRTTVLPELNDELAQDEDPECSTLEELKEKLRKKIEEDAAREQEDALAARVLEKLVEQTEFDPPQLLVEKELASLYPAAKSEHAEVLRSTFTPLAERRVKERFVLRKVAELEKLMVPPSELNERIRAIAEHYGHDFDEERMIWMADGRYDALKEQMLLEKARQWLKEHAIVVEPSPQSGSEQAPAAEAEGDASGEAEGPAGGEAEASASAEPEAPASGEADGAESTEAE